jgi:simple sugar transport system substrate-binding protein
VKGAFEAMVAGKLNCTVECNPLIGPQLFDIVAKVADGKSVPARVAVEEGTYDESQAKEALPKRQY